MTKQSILIVEDEASWQEIYQEMLEDQYNLTAVSTYAQAQTELYRQRFDVAIIDPSLDLEDDSNRDGIRLIRSLIPTLDYKIPIVVITAAKSRVQVNDPQLSGFIDDIVEKTAPPEEIRSRIAAVLNKTKAKSRWRELSALGASLSGYDVFKKTLIQLKEIARADVAHLVMRAEENPQKLEIVGDTEDDEGRSIDINDSLTGKAYLARIPMKIDDTTHEKAYKPVRTSQGLRNFKSELAVPVERNGEIVGVLNVERDAGPFEDWQVELVNTFGKLTVLIAQNDLKQTKIEHLSLIARGFLKSALDLDKIWDSILQPGLELINAQIAVICRYDGECLVVEGSTHSRFKGMRLGLDTIAGNAVQEGLTQKVLNVDGKTNLSLNAEGTSCQSEMAVPFFADNVNWVLDFIREKPDEFTVEQEKLVLLLATYASLAISRQSQARTQAQLEGQRTLAGKVAHGAGNPAFIIRNQLALISQSDLEGIALNYPEVDKTLNAIKRNIQYVLDEIVQLYRVYTSLSKTNVNESIKSVLGKISSKMDEKNLNLDLQLQPNLPLIWGDEIVGEIVYELVQNAVEATSSGTITIRTGLQDGKVAIRVEDSGRGMSPETRQRVFLKGFSTKRTQTMFDGFGLAWCKDQIEKLYHGSIAVEKTEIGLGTTMLILLPSESEITKF